MLVLIVSLSVKCCTKLGKIQNEQIRTCVYAVCLHGKIRGLFFFSTSDGL
jgi:hypothetical protein